ncbi:unnamed protein product (macronuclear) [Paramecium tetraurelia]|uniref:Transmembrane protein n=1 Tax=Paramecium tetraurelia TaxID=5888 RepID=A0BZR8_PARTE|nr:uncharacterized protein GSPATT00005887001 [Paramecium tetraurelia]CAK64035.1 unnamed protein product [Paramecium tetraurelia]|eukprot:XP_001431433.1 hypothetical protein (macronuclear) [Paramecium tetraurelia strain d4-2]
MNNISSLLYLIPLILFVLHKLSAIILLYYYLLSKTQDRFVRLISKKIFLKVLGIFFTIYIKLISTILLIIFGLLCMASFKIQFIQQNQDNLFQLHLITNIITILLLLIESTFILYFYESSITHQQRDIERTRFTYLRALYQILIIIQVSMILLGNMKYYIQIQSFLAIFSQITLLIDQYHSVVYSLDYQRQSIALGVSFNISFHIIALIHINISLQSYLLPLFVNQMLIYQIIRNYSRHFDQTTLKILFDSKVQVYWQLKYWLIKLLNNDIPNISQEVIFKSLIASQHRQVCMDLSCVFCSHSKIINPTYTSGITKHIYNDFLMEKLQQFLTSNTFFQQSSDNNGLLQYAFALYDCGMIMKSIKILCFLQEYHQNQDISKLQSFSQYQDDNHQLSHFELITLKPKTSQENYDLLCNLTKTSQDSKLIQILQHQQSKKYSMIDQIKLKFVFNNAKANINKSLGTSSEATQQNYITNYTEQVIEKDLQVNIQEQSVLKVIQAKVDLYQQLVQTSSIKQSILHFHNQVHRLCHYFYALDKQLKKAYLQSPCFHLHRVISFFLGEVLGEYRRSINFYKNSEFFEAPILQFKQIKNFNINSKHVYYLILEAKDDMESFTIQSYSNKFYKNFGTTKSANQTHQFNDLLPKYLVKHHCTYVKRFFETGVAKYYQQFDLSFIRNSNMLLTPINMCLSITNKFLNQNVTFAAFFQDTSYDQAYILIDSASLKCTFTENLLILIGWTEIEIQCLSKQENLNEFDINKIFPSFVRMIKSNQEKLFKVNYCTLILPKIQDNLQTQRSLFSENSQLFLNYVKTQCDLIIIKQTIDNYEYYLINVIKIVETQTTSVLNKKIFQQQSINVENGQNNEENFHDNQTSGEKMEALFSTVKEEHIDIHKKTFIQKIHKESNIDNVQIDKMYSLIESILSVKTPKYLQKFVVLMLIWHSIFIIFVTIFFVSLQEDIQQVKSHLEMVTFYAAIMAPHDLFFSMRVTITAYQQMQREGFLTQKQVTELTNPYYDHIELGFTELRDSFYEQLNNKYLQEFLNDINVTMYFMKDDEKSIYPLNLTFRDALLVILQYQYSQMMTFYYRQSTSGKPFQISLFANYFMLHSKCEQLSNEITIYSIENKNYIHRKWSIITFVGFSSLILFYLIIQSYQIYFFVQLDQMYELINTLTFDIVQKEIDKFHEYINNYKLDRYILLDYDPIDRYCNQIENYQRNLGQQYIKVKIKTKNQPKLINYSMLFSLCALLSIYFILIFSNTNTYLQKYEGNLQFYKILQDLKLRPGSLFLYREIFFRWSNFTFLTEENQQELYSLVDKAEQSINSYLENTNAFYVNSQIIDDEFDQLYSLVSQDNLCQFIDKKFQNLTSKYCNLSFDGSLKSGMISTLNHLLHSIQTQKAVNNFTKRVEVSLYEQEGSQIVTRVFFSLSNQFSKSAASQADFSIQLIKILSLGFIVYIIIVLLMMQLIYRPYLQKLFKVLKRSVYLIPFDSLFSSESLELRLKSISYKLQLL